MRVVFFNSNTIRHPAWLVVRMLLPLVTRIIFEAILFIVVAVIFFIAVVRQSITAAILLGAAPILLGAMFMGMGTAIHEMSHAFAGARLVDSDYPLALVVPTFRNPFIRFAPHRLNVPPAQIIVILLMGSLAGLLVSALILLALLTLPDPGNIRWVWGAYGLAIAIPQVVTLVPIGQTDGAKVAKLMREKSVTWLEVGRAARQLFHS